MFYGVFFEECAVLIVISVFSSKTQVYTQTEDPQVNLLQYLTADNMDTVKCGYKQGYLTCISIKKGILKYQV